MDAIMRQFTFALDSVKRLDVSDGREITGIGTYDLIIPDLMLSGQNICPATVKKEPLYIHAAERILWK